MLLWTIFRMAEFLVQNMDEKVGGLIAGLGNPAVEMTGNVVKRISKRLCL